MSYVTALVRSYRLPLTAAGFGPVREGLLLRLSTPRGGAVGWGEAAPLPGFSRETLDEARRSLESLGFQAQSVPFDAESPLEWAVGLSEEAPSSVRFAVESAAANLAASITGVTTAEVLAHAAGTRPRSECDLAALLAGDPRDWPARLDEAIDGGYGTVKLKVGRVDLSDEIAALGALPARLRPGVVLRFDANRAWSLDDALRFADAARDLPVEFVEEPLADPSDLEEFARRSGLPMALDETIHSGPAFRPADWPFVIAWVLKPTLVGGIVRSLGLAATAAAQGVRTVISSSYETGVGLRHLVSLACALPGVPTAAGLDTARALGADVTEPRFDTGTPSAFHGRDWAVRPEVAA